MPENHPPLRRILNCEPSRATQKDWLFRHATGASILAAGGIPSSRDLREPWWRINDQGSTGSYVGWASADGVTRWHMVKAARLAEDELLSPRFLWMASKETDIYDSYPSTFIESDGTSLKAAVDIAPKCGTVTDTVLPLASGALYPGEADTFYAIAAQRKIASYFNHGADLTQWRTRIAQNGPVLVRLDVDETWDNARVANGKVKVCKPATVRGGRAVAFVGHTPTTFIVRNSWGIDDNWGDNGFGYASNASAKAVFAEADGVSL